MLDRMHQCVHLQPLLALHGASKAEEERLNAEDNLNLASAAAAVHNSANESSGDSSGDEEVGEPLIAAAADDYNGSDGDYAD